MINFFICSIGVYFFGLYLFKKHFPSIFFAVSFTYCSFLIQQLGHFQIASIPWIGFLFLFLFKYLRESKIKNGLIFVVFWILISLDSYYIGYIVSIAVVVVFIVHLFLNKRFYDREFWKLSSILIIIFLVFLLLPSIPYLQVRKFYHFKRSIRENVFFSADFPLSFISPSSFNLLFQYLPDKYHRLLQVEGAWEKPLFIGYINLIFLIYYLAVSRKLNKPSFDRWQKYFFILALIFFILSLGPVLNVAKKKTHFSLPYMFFFRTIPGFSSMRVPARFGIVYVFSLAGIASLGVNVFISRFSRSIPKTIVSVGIMVVLIFELLANIPVAYIGKVPEAVRYYSQNGNSSHKLLAYYPAEVGPDFNNPFLSGKYIYYSSYHNFNTINGYSGYIPDSVFQAQLFLAEIDKPQALCYLHNLGIREIIVLPHLSEKKDLEKIDELVSNGLLMVKSSFVDGSLTYIINEQRIVAYGLNAGLLISADMSADSKRLIFKLKPDGDGHYFVRSGRDLFETARFTAYNSDEQILWEIKKNIVLPAIVSNGGKTLLKKRLEKDETDVKRVKIEFLKSGEYLFLPIRIGETNAKLSFFEECTL
jgi:hypothetical protein